MDVKRRVSLPRHLLDQVGIAAGTRLVAHVGGPGRVVIETPEAAAASAMQRIWDDLDPAGSVAPLNFAETRISDAATAEANIAARLSGQSASVGADEDLLRTLGIAST